MASNSIFYRITMLLICQLTITGLYAQSNNDSESYDVEMFAAKIRNLKAFEIMDSLLTDVKASKNKYVKVSLERNIETDRFHYDELMALHIFYDKPTIASNNDYLVYFKGRKYVLEEEAVGLLITPQSKRYTFTFFKKDISFTRHLYPIILICDIRGNIIPLERGSEDFYRFFE